MDKTQIVKVVGMVVGAVAALTLVSASPVKVAFLGVGAAIYFIGPKFVK